jgi:uncharacterized protein YhfF
MNWRALDRFSFGDSPTLGDEIAELVLAGRKRATCWAISDGPITNVGKRMVTERASQGVLETVELVQWRFSEIDEAFAFDEGEGDRTLTYWRTALQSYFERHGTFSPDMVLFFCERFWLVERIGFWPYLP